MSETRRQAQALMNDAQNHPGATTCGCHPHVGGTISASSISIGQLTPPARDDLRVSLRGVPAEVSVELSSLVVRRGDAWVLVIQDLENEWGIGGFEHEAAAKDRKQLGQAVPFVHEALSAVFPTSAEAVTYAARWLDCLDAWYGALEQATHAVEEFVGTAAGI